MKIFISVEVETGTDLQLEEEGLSISIANLINNNDDLGVAMEVTGIEKEVIITTRESLYPLKVEEVI